jgi:hypothetical protein
MLSSANFRKPSGLNEPRADPKAVSAFNAVYAINAIYEFNEIYALYDFNAFYEISEFYAINASGESPDVRSSKPED